MPLSPGVATAQGADPKTSQDSAQTTVTAPLQKPATTESAQDSAQAEEEIPFQISADNLKGQGETGEDFLLLEGNVRIVHGTTAATGATGIYFRNSRIATLGGGVRIVDGETIMNSRRATYSLETQVATLQENVHIKNADVTLTGAVAEFRRRENVAVVSGNVTMVDSTRKIDADRIVYHRDTELVEATGNVTAFDRPNDATVTGGQALYNRNTKVALVTSSPKLVSTDKKGKQTVVVGEEMEFLMDKDIFKARGSVHINREDMEATCQLAEFFRNENRAALSGQPRAWDKDGEILGDSLELLTDGDQIRTVKVFENAQVFYRAPAGQEAETSLVRGDSIRILMDNEEVKEVFVYGHAHSEYFSAAGRKPTSNTADGETLHLEVRDRKPYKATFDGVTSGKYHFSTASGDSMKQEEVEYSSKKKIEFFVGEHLINLTGQAELKYKNLRLIAEQVAFDSDKQSLEATGEPILWEGEQKVTGDRMTYSLESARGTIFHGNTRFQKGFYTGDQIRKVGDKILDVRVGDYTTCELKEPHYHFTGTRMKVYANDKVIVKPLILYVRKIPVLALPFYVFPIKPGRHSGFLIPQVEFGLSSNKGRFIRNAGYYWAVNEYADATAWIDYYESSPRWIGYLEGRYEVRYKLSGYLNTSYSRNEGLGTSQWDLRGSHLQKLGEGLDLSMEGDFVSDKTYRLDRGLGRDFVQRMNQILRSKMSLTKRWASAQLTGAYDRTDYMNTDPTDGVNELTRSELRPKVSLSLQSKAIGRASKGGKDKGWLPWLSSMYLSASSVLVSESKKYELSEDTHSGMSTRLSLRDARKLFGILNVSPGLSYTENWYDKDLLGNKYERSGVWSASMTGSATLYRVFMPRLGPLDGIRHSLSPSLQFSYQPDFPEYSYVDEYGTRRSRFPSFSSISTSWSKSQLLSMALSNRFQAKLKWKDRVIKLDDLLDLNVSTSYDFLYKEKNNSQAFSNINTSVRLKPTNNLSSELFLTHDPVKFHMTSMSLVSNVSFQTGGKAGGGEEPEEAAPGERVLEGESAAQGVDEDTGDTEEKGISLPPLQGAFTFSYNRGEDRASASYWVDGNAGFDLSPNWRVQYSAHYDLKDKEIISQRFSLYRDLHCWEAYFTRVFSGQKWEYYFKINIKAHKEIYVERGTAQ
ncbi:MAG: putative LPS assembly protein LptD [Candidatus Eisenbacteria bacterium]|nr:putative LPS assembly protein LptD [Candidatus Eisenbacteria bacterium]